jgi:DNA-directed RNA polymerase specialized sigma24 family protein
VLGLRRTRVFFSETDLDDDPIATAHGVEIVEREDQTLQAVVANPGRASLSKRICVLLQTSDAAANDPFYQAAINAAKTRAYRAAVSAGLTRSDREDLYQEVMADLLERAVQYDPSKGSPGTFTGMVSQHRTADFLRALKKDRWRLSVFSDHTVANDNIPEEADSASIEPEEEWMADDRDLFADSEALHDLCIAVDHMSDDQAALFEILEAHQDLPSACKASGMSSATFYRRVADLQMHLRMFGFKAAA